MRYICFIQARNILTHNSNFFSVICQQKRLKDKHPRPNLSFRKVSPIPPPQCSENGGCSKQQPSRGAGLVTKMDIWAQFMSREPTGHNVHSWSPKDTPSPLPPRHIAKLPRKRDKEPVFAGNSMTDSVPTGLQLGIFLSYGMTCSDPQNRRSPVLLCHFPSHVMWSHQCVVSQPYHVNHTTAGNTGLEERPSGHCTTKQTDLGLPSAPGCTGDEPHQPAA